MGTNGKENVLPIIKHRLKKCSDEKKKKRSKLYHSSKDIVESPYYYDKVSAKLYPSLIRECGTWKSVDIRVSLID